MTRHRVCKRCKIDRPVKEFVIDRSKRRGYKMICRACEAARARARYAAARGGQVREYTRRSGSAE